MSFYVCYGNPKSNLNVNYDDREVCAAAGIEPGSIYQTFDQALEASETLAVAMAIVAKRDDWKGRGRYLPGENGLMFHIRETNQDELDIAEWRKQYPWIDPDNVETTEVSRYIAVKNAASHKSTPRMRVCHSKHFELIDNTEWEIFSTSLTGVVDGKRYYWGSFVEGLGFFHMMVAEENMRELTDSEKAAWSNARMSMSGWHSGNHAYDFSLGEIK
jgi:hypothetical protein